MPAEYAEELERKKQKSADKRATPEQKTLLEKLQKDRDAKVKAWQGRLPSDGKKLSEQLRLARNPVRSMVTAPSSDVRGVQEDTVREREKH